MTVRLPEKVKELADSTTYVALATLRADGSPRMTVLWITRDGDELLLSTRRGSAKERDISRDGRVGLMFLDQKDPYGYVEVRGNASITEEGGDDLIDELALKYTGSAYQWDGDEAVRVVVRVVPEKVLTVG